jgi:hypothetical protein
MKQWCHKKHVAIVERVSLKGELEKLQDEIAHVIAG